MSELKEPSPSVEQLLSIVVVQNQRVYDVLLALLSQQSEEVARNLVEVHERMDNISPAPYVVSDNDD
jgi:hypothetical protein